MAGLIFLAAVVAFLLFCIWLSKTIGNLVPNAAWRGAVKVGIFLALLAAPFVDEVIGKYQFEALCKANGIERADVSKAQGKRVRLEVGEPLPLYGTIMPGVIKEWLYKDAERNEIVIHHKGYSASGGWLMRYTPVSMGAHHPMLFPGGCPIDYLDRDTIFSKNSITLVN